MKLTALFILINLTLVGTSTAAQNGWTFNPAFLNGENGNTADLSWVTEGLELPPGNYDVSVFVNQKFTFTGKVLFKGDGPEAEKKLSPCVTLEQIAAMGIDFSQAQSTSGPQVLRCYILSHYFPDVKFDFDKKTLSVWFTLPQRYMQNLPRGYVSPESWQSGILAAWLNYVINGSRNDYRGENRSQQNRLFTSLNSGINLGSWRLRDYSTWTHVSGSDNKLTHIRSWLQRDLPGIQSQLWLGETYTSAQLFDAVGLRGIALSTDDNMLPASLRGYAPEVRGIASSNATVTVRQSGNIIYQTSVPPGEFLLQDLYPTSSGGDLSITIQEEDGKEKRYEVPFASVPNLVRHGQFKYSLGLGKYRPGYNQDDPLFFHGDVFYGWRYGLTFYGGAQLAENYTGLALGIGHNMGRLGAYSLDVIHSLSRLPDDKHYSGDSIRLRYSKMINDYGTRLNFYSWRFSTKGFYNLSDTTYKQMAGNNTAAATDNNGSVQSYIQNYYNLRLARKAKNQLMLSQNIRDFGSLSLSWEKQTYWRTDKSTEGIQFAWNNTWRNVSWGLNYQRSTSLYDSKKDNIISFSFSVPLGKLNQATRLRYAMTHSDSAGSTHSAGISGYLPNQNNFYYNLNQRYSAQQHYGGDMSLQYQGARGNYNLSYSYSPIVRNINYGVSGGIVLHENGLTLSQPLGNTNILIKAPGAADVAVKNHKGIKTDSRGYAVIPYSTPYRLNRVEMDVTTAGNEVEIDNAVVNIVPTEGALVRATIPVKIGMKAMFIVRNNKGVLPFGSVVTLRGAQQSSSIIGDGGSLYLSGLPQQGKLTAVWGKGTDKTCTAEYRLSKKYYRAATGLYSQELVCH